jgi:hypothetical protein
MLFEGERYLLCGQSSRCPQFFQAAIGERGGDPSDFAAGCFATPIGAERMDMATFLKSAANVLVGVGLVKLLTADLKAEIRHDSASLRDKAKGLVQKSPYHAAGLAAVAAALTGFVLLQRRTHSQQTRQ